VIGMDGQARGVGGVDGVWISDRVIPRRQSISNELVGGRIKK
jgi:hypothetical protein